MLLVSIEGVEGASKSTQAKMLVEWLNNEYSHKTLLTKEPGSVQVEECKKIREILLNPSNIIDPRAELFLYMADRAQHVSNFIKPQMQAGSWVVCDRFIDSTVVYQGDGRGFDKGLLNTMIEFATGGLKPDMTFVLDLPVEIGLERAMSSNKEFAGGDRMERESVEFHQKLRTGFLELAKTDNRFVVINANKTAQEIHEEMKTIFNYRMEHHFFSKYGEDI